MYRYRLYGMRIKSELEFKQLMPEVPDGRELPEIIILPMGEELRTDRMPTGQYVLGSRFSWLSNQTMYLAVQDGNAIFYRLKEGADPFCMRSFILGFGMAMLGLQRGVLAIHCSAVADSRGAVLIAGESGAGKSTLTSAFLDRGYRLMADDMTFVKTLKGESPMAYPAFPYQKLCRDAAIRQGWQLEDLLYINEQKDKFLVPFRGIFSPEPEPVHAMLMLSGTGNDYVRSREVTGIRKLSVIAGNLFLRNLLGEEKFRPDIGQMCLETAAKIPIFWLGRPRAGDSTEEIRRQAFTCLERVPGCTEKTE